MGSLCIFGDNSSAIFGRTQERRFEYYRRYRNDNFPISWSEILSAKLNLKLNNYAVEGQSNYDIFEWFCKMSDRIKPNDIVLIGWSHVQRFRLYDEFTKNFITIRPNAIKNSNTPSLLNGISQNTLDETLKNRTNNKCIEEVGHWEKLMTDYCMLKKCFIFYWTFDNTLNKPHYIGGDQSDFREHLISIGAEDITKEAKGFLVDDNFGEIGHQIQANYFLNHLNDHITNRQ